VDRVEFGIKQVSFDMTRKQGAISTMDFFFSLKKTPNFFVS
jgi:hypothetical protein